MIPEFDCCHFCKNDDWYTSCHYKCDICTQKKNEKPTEFEEKLTVTVYRKTIEELNKMKGDTK